MTRLTALPLSLFALLRDEFGDTLTPLRCTKATLVHLSHTLEDLVLRDRLPALLFTGFQESSHWRRETERYRALAEIAQQVCIFAGAPLPPESSARQLHVTLEGGDPLRQEWFLALLCPQFCVLLCGQDRQVPTSEEATRQFDTLWSFSPTIVSRVLDLLEQVVASYRPDRLPVLQAARQRTPLVTPDPDIVTRFTAEMIRYEEQLNQRLHASSRSLEAQMRWRHDMQALVAHDMRTPLQSISTAVELLRNERLLPPEDRGEMLAFVQRGVHQLTDLTQLILDVHGLEGGQLSVRWEALAPQQLADDALVPVRMLLQRAGLSLQVQIAPEVAVVWCDGALMRRVLQNLLTNAIKFTPPDGEIALGVALTPRRDGVELRVRDSGQGIAKAALPQIFERHYQENRQDRRGSGLGLYFCRLVAEAHSGSIRADSQVGVGTTITLTLPLRPAITLGG